MKRCRVGAAICLYDAGMDGFRLGRNPFEAQMTQVRDVLRPLAESGQTRNRNSAEFRKFTPIVTVAATLGTILCMISIARQTTFIDTEAYFNAGEVVRHHGSLYERALAWREHGWTIEGPN